MKPKFRTPEQVAQFERKEQFSVNIPEIYLSQLRKEAKQKKVAVGSLVNEAIRAYCEFLDEFKKDPGI